MHYGQKRFLEWFWFFFNLSRLDLWPRMWSILEKVLCVLEKTVKFIVLRWNVLQISIRSNWSIVSLKVCVSLLILEIKAKINKWDLINIYRTFHPKTMNFTFFSSAHGLFSRVDHILGHKSNLDKFKKIEIIPSIFSDHNALRLELSYRRKTIKNSNFWRMNNMLLNNQQITEEIKKEIKICIETNENENTTTQNLWDTIKAVLRGKFIAIQAYLKK